MPNMVDIYSRHTFDCSCGRTHVLPIGSVDISRGAARRVPAKVAEHALGEVGMLLTDEVVFDGLGKDIHATWLEQGLAMQAQVLKGRVVPTEETVGRVICGIPQDVSYLVTLGGGTVTDIGRYVGSRLKLPVIAIPSAMTMDGFFTNMSVIIINGLQRTLYLDYPAVILADTDIISQCPAFMNAAGVGEVVAKISAGLDWYVAHQVKDVYYCAEIADMMDSCIVHGAGDPTVDGIRGGDSEAVSQLADGLYRSAVGMAWYDSSVCGSGAEHQLNHFWVMCQDNRGAPQSMHGQAVGSGSVVNLMIWEEIMKHDLSSLPAGVGDAMDRDAWVAGVTRVYGDGADDIFALQEHNHSFDPSARAAELVRVRERAAALRGRFLATPPADELADKLRRAGTATSPVELGITRQEFVDSILYAKEMRAGRYNSLWLAETLGFVDEIAETVAAKLGY